jgi:creatinine amidohydrolase
MPARDPERTEEPVRPGQTAPTAERSSLPSYALDDLTWTEVQEILAEAPRMILPIGALDQHGPHLPLGTHSFIAGSVARDVSQTTGTLRAPLLPYGVNEGASHQYAGTASLRRKTLHRAVNELLGRWEDHGVRHFLMLTAHRFEPHIDALLMALSTRADTSVVDLLSVDVSDIVESPPGREHAGELETSLLLYLAPDRVRADRIRDRPLEGMSEYRKYVRGKQPTPPPGSEGVVGRPSLGTAEKGRLMYQRYLSLCRGILMEEGNVGTE